MTNLLLVTRPKYDDGTEYLSAYALEILKRAKLLNIDFKDFEGKNVTKREIEKYIKSKNPQLLFLNGHGDVSGNEIYGHNNQVIFSLSNVNLLKKRITYARACFAAISLGQEAVRDNSGCFIGYRFPFSFFIDDRWSTKPLNDKLAALYLNPSNELVLSLLNGKTVNEADKKSKKMMIRNMKEILAMESRKEPGATRMLEILWGNYEGQIVLGNKEAFF
jgi:hypothetical protein